MCSMGGEIENCYLKDIKNFLGEGEHLGAEWDRLTKKGILYRGTGKSL